MSRFDQIGIKPGDPETVTMQQLLIETVVQNQIIIAHLEILSKEEITAGDVRNKGDI